MKLQKLQAPKTKYQKNTNDQNSKFQTMVASLAAVIGWFRLLVRRRRMEFGACDLGFEVQ